MASPPNSFPAGFPIPVGITVILQATNVSIPTTPVFTAAVSGLYLVSLGLGLVSTNGVGSPLAATCSTTRIPILTTGGASPATNQDGAITTRTVWMNKGDQIFQQVTASGLTGTTYQVITNVARML